MKMAADDRIAARLADLLSAGNALRARTFTHPQDLVKRPYVDLHEYSTWRMGCRAFVSNILPNDHPYVTAWQEVGDINYLANVEHGLGVLEAVRQDASFGLLRPIKSLVACEVFSDFMEMCKHLIEQGYKDPAASLCGAVLEDGLRQIATARNLSHKKTDGLDALNKICHSASVYNALTFKRVDSWREIRNNADHGKFGEYKSEDVDEMITGVTRLLSDNLG